MFIVRLMPLAAADYGILADQSLDLSAHGPNFNDGEINYAGTVIPFVSVSFGEKSYFLLSAGLTYRFDPFLYAPELLQTEISFGIGPHEIKAGRMQYTDPLGIIAHGFFDGLSLLFNTKAGRIEIGGWYTGFLFKTRANIAMTEDELLRLDEGVKFDSLENFKNTYFAPKRILSAVSWENYYLGGLIDFRFTALGQFDLTDADLNSQYFIAEFALLTKHFVFDLGGCFELIQDSTGWEFQEMKKALAVKAGLTFKFPTYKERTLSLHGIYTSGVFEDGSFSPFLPLTTIPQGDLLNVKISGLSVFSLNYLAKPAEVLSLNWSASYFVRSDLGTYHHYPVIGIDSDGHFLGPEFYLKLFWNTSSGFKMTTGGGFFIPALGNAARDMDVLWKMEVSFVFSLL